MSCASGCSWMFLVFGNSRTRSTYRFWWLYDSIEIPSLHPLAGVMAECFLLLGNRKHSTTEGKQTVSNQKKIQNLWICNRMIFHSFISHSNRCIIVSSPHRSFPSPFSFLYTFEYMNCSVCLAFLIFIFLLPIGLLSVSFLPSSCREPDTF